VPIKPGQLHSAGLLDYFFRGRISASAAWNNSAQEYTITVRNDSGEIFGSGGTFIVLKEEASGDRIPLLNQTLSNPLSANDTVSLTFDGPELDAVEFVVVYRGSIGMNGSSAQDSVDADIAIAATKLDVCQTPQCWIDALQTIKGTPEFTVANLQVLNQQSAEDYCETDCYQHGGDNFIWFGDGGICFLGGFTTGYSGMSDDMVLLHVLRRTFLCQCYATSGAALDGRALYLVDWQQ